MVVMQRGKVCGTLAGLLLAPFVFFDAGDGVGSVESHGVRY